MVTCFSSEDCHAAQNRIPAHTHRPPGTDPPHIPYHTHSFAMSIRIATLPLATVLVCTTFSTVLAKPLYAPALDRTVRQVTRVSDPADELTGDNDRDSDPNGSGDRPTDRPETQPTPAPTRVPTFPSPGNRCIRVSANQPGNAVRLNFQASFTRSAVVSCR